MLYLKEPYSDTTISSLIKYPMEESPDGHVADHSNRYLVDPVEGNGSDTDSDVSNTSDDSSSNDEADILDHNSFITAVNMSVIVINLFTAYHFQLL